MKDYLPNQIRNVALVSHHGTGKTSLAEAALFRTKAIARQGKIEDGTTALDFTAEEQHRQISISLGLAPIEWKNHKINLIDTPGYADFVGDLVPACARPTPRSSASRRPRVSRRGPRSSGSVSRSEAVRRSAP